MASFSDDFNRADGAVGGGWAGYPNYTGDFVVDTNTLRNVSGFDYVAPAITADFTDVEITCDINAGSNGGLIARWDADTNSGYYLSYWVGDGWYLVRYDAGSEATTIDTSTESIDAVWHTVVWSITGSVHVVSVDGSDILSGSDPTYASGYAGIGARENTTMWDNFSVTELGSSALGGTLTPTTWANKLALEALTM